MKQRPAHWAWRAGWILSGLTIAFLTLDAGMKIAEAPISIDATAELGYPAHLVRPMGMLLLVSTLLYALPQTSLIGAILVTGYLGGAVATQFRVENPLFSHVFFGVYIGLLLWGGVYLRKPAFRTLISLR
jgi:hypothetical protein